MSTQWFCQISEVPYGPLTGSDLKRMAKNGHLSPRDLVRKSGVDKWYRARSIQGLVFGAATARREPVMVEAPAGTMTTANDFAMVDEPMEHVQGRPPEFLPKNVITSEAQPESQSGPELQTWQLVVGIFALPPVIAPVSAVVAGCLLRLMCSLFSVSEPSFGRAWWICLVAYLTNLLILGLSFLFAVAVGIPSLVWLGFPLSATAITFIYSRMLRIAIGKAIPLWAIPAGVGILLSILLQLLTLVLQ